ncbi:MAG: peptide-methionine (R)-S-oxide reductase [Pseudomonadota bacterium]
MPNHSFSRRQILAGSATSVAGLVAAPAVHSAYISRDDGFPYEVTRSEADWREILSPAAFETLREGGTEVPKSSPYWDSTAPGMYHCAGCGLPLYDAHWKVVLDIGWLFFKHSEPNSLLMGLDWPTESREEKYEPVVMMEIHCRRCGGHHGHLVSIDNKVLHCVNGVGMEFIPQQA